MSELPQSLRDFLGTGPLAHLSTTGRDGAPQVSVIWVGVDGDDLVSGHLNRYQKIRNIEREPRVVLSFDRGRADGVVMAPYAVVHATATLEEGGAWQLLDDLTKIYVGPDETFPAPRTEGGTIIRYRVERIGGVGTWAP